MYVSKIASLLGKRWGRTLSIFIIKRRRVSRNNAWKVEESGERVGGGIVSSRSSVSVEESGMVEMCEQNFFEKTTRGNSNLNLRTYAYALGLHADKPKRWS